MRCLLLLCSSKDEWTCNGDRKPLWFDVILWTDDFFSCKLYSHNYEDLSYYFVIWDKISGTNDVNSKKQVKHYTWVMQSVFSYPSAKVYTICSSNHHSFYHLWYRKSLCNFHLLRWLYTNLLDLPAGIPLGHSLFPAPVRGLCSFVRVHTAFVWMLIREMGDGLLII